MNNAYQQHKNLLVPTSSDIEGPFYKPNAPILGNNILSPKDIVTNLYLTGSVTNTFGEGIPGVVLDVWQANEIGEYDNEGFRYRGKIKTSDTGRYELYTIHPGDYKIGPNEFRCAHIHFKLSHPDYIPITTQLYFENDKYNKTDHWFNMSRVINRYDNFTFVLVPKESK